MCRYTRTNLPIQPEGRILKSFRDATGHKLNQWGACWRGPNPIEGLWGRVVKNSGSVDAACHKPPRHEFLGRAVAVLRPPVSMTFPY